MENTAQPSLALAPMEGVTDYPFRLWLHLASQPDWLATPFLRVTASFPNAAPLDWAPERFHSGIRDVTPYRLIPQLMSPTVDFFVRTAERYFAEESTIEINCGCPSPRVVGHGAGSSLLASTDLFHSTIRKVASALGPHRLAVKMRTGYDDDRLFTDLHQGLAELPLAYLTVHGRTKEQRYTGLANWQQIQAAAASTPVPTNGSGDVVDQASLIERLRQAPGVAAVLIGRGALRNPWIFAELRSKHEAPRSRALIGEALAAFALLTEAQGRDAAALYRLISSRPIKSLDDSVEKWENFNRELLPLLGTNEFANATFSKPTLGKVKMVWCYLQTHPAFAHVEKTALLLRSSTVHAFFAGLYEL